MNANSDIILRFALTFHLQLASLRAKHSRSEIIPNPLLLGKALQASIKTCQNVFQQVFLRATEKLIAHITKYF